MDILRGHVLCQFTFHQTHAANFFVVAFVVFVSLSMSIGVAAWTITERGFENNVYKLCVPFGIATMGILSYLTGPFTTFFLTVFCVLEILSQEFHKWSHMTKSQTPAFVEKLQKAGLTIGRTPHAQHHLAPYDGNYCIISGVCNPILDKSGFFRRLERLVYNVNGVESNAWKLDADLRDRTLKGNYQLID